MSTVQLSESDLGELITQVWETYVDQQPLLPAAGSARADWSATVSVSGAWRGSVLLELDDAAAREVAALMLDVMVVEVDEVLDAVGELANMVGGNVKSLMPEPSVLSLPSVTRGPAYPVGELVCSLPLEWQGHHLRLQMYRTDEEQH